MFFNSNFNRIQQMGCYTSYELNRGDSNCIYDVGEEFIKYLSYYNFISNQLLFSKSVILGVV